MKYRESVARLIGFGFMTTLFLPFLPGCGKEEPVRIVHVPKSRSNLKEAHLQTSPQSRAPFMNGMGMPAARNISGPKRMLAAMILHPVHAYFIKITDADQTVEKIKDDFRKIVQSISFSDKGEMKWELPSGWKQEPGSNAFRVATLKNQDGTEVAVTKLTPNQPILANINRWQDQLGVKRSSKEELKLEETTIEGVKVYLYDESTASKKDDEGSKNTSNENEKLKSSGEKSNAKVSDPEIPFVVTKPGDQWTSLPPKSEAKHLWETGEGSEKLKIGIYKFGAQVDFFEYARIWTGRAKLPGINKDSFQKAVSEISVAEKKCEFFSSSEEKGNGLLIARLVSGQSAWYFKLEGQAEAVKQQVDSFKKWLEGLKATSKN